MDQQREQKRVTREKVLQAGRAIFEQRPYASVSVEMIVDEASISRATFYRHFDSKLAVAVTLFQDLATQIQDLWKELLELPEPSLADARSWLLRHIDVAGRGKVLGLIMREIDINEPGTQSRTLQFYEKLMEQMWGRRWDGRPGHFGDLWSRSLLVLLQMDEFFFAILTRNWAIDHESLIEAMALLLHEFLQFRNSERASVARPAAKKNDAGMANII